MITIKPEIMIIPKWNITEMTGYEPKTTFWDDFSIADKFGLDAIQDTYKKAMKEWSKDYIYMTELAMVLNWKCWEHYHRSRNELKPFRDDHAQLSKWYSDQYYKMLDWADKHLKKNELVYFYDTLD